MKQIYTLIILLILVTVSLKAQDTLYVYESETVIAKHAIARIDSLSFTPPSPFAGTFPDLDGNRYRSIKIGNQVWMTENLKTTKFRNGESIPNLADNSAWTSTLSAAYSDYDNNPNNGIAYGRLYNWYAASDSRNIAPAGWHVPTTEEWTQLVDYLIANGYNFDGNMTNNKIAKSLASKNLWKNSGLEGAPGNNPSSNNTTGFNGLPGGLRYHTNGASAAFGEGAYFWTNSQNTDVEAHYYNILYGYYHVVDNVNAMRLGLAIRCVKSDLASLITSSISNVSSTSAIAGGEITYDGKDVITERGVCWSTSPAPTIMDSKTVDGAGPGSFVSNVSNLSPGTDYYLRAYAINSVGISYGQEKTFKTLNTPTTTTGIVITITSTSAISGGEVTSDGGSTITARGVCWSTNPHPTITDTKTNDGTGLGIFVSTITNLSPATKYYLRSYSTNAIGTAYGNEVEFETFTLIP